MPFSRSSPSSSANGDEDTSIGSYSFSSASTESPPQAQYGHKIRSLNDSPAKTVRILVPSSTQDDTVLLQSHNIVMPQDQVAEAPKLGSGSRWTATQLDLLNVHYDPTVHHVFHFEDMELPPPLSQCTYCFNDPDA